MGFGDWLDNYLLFEKTPRWLGGGGCGSLAVKIVFKSSKFDLRNDDFTRTRVYY
jgi:hypothetical protein